MNKVEITANFPHKMPEVEIFEPVTPEQFDAVRRLFKEYMEYLFELPDMQVHIELKGSGKELAELEKGYYAPPSGAILLATYRGEYAGAVALRKLTPSICEMKRLYVSPAYRGAAIGLQLAQQIIRKGKEMGYTAMRLDTHPSLKKAQQLYYSLGFYDIHRYNQNTIPGILFMEIDLKGNS